MATDVPLIDYYSVLNLPHGADLTGIENAYARLSHELAMRAEVDETAPDALLRVNEAFSVLGRPELRRAYDQELFKDAIAEAQRLRRAQMRRRDLKERVIVGSLTLVVVIQAGALAYVGRDQAFSLFNAIVSVLA